VLIGLRREDSHASVQHCDPQFFLKFFADEHAPNQSPRTKNRMASRAITCHYIDEGITMLRIAMLPHLITMDTPGGLSDSMKDMIQHILSFVVPVAVYVIPPARARRPPAFTFFFRADNSPHGARHSHRRGFSVDHVGEYPVAMTNRCAAKSPTDAQASLGAASPKTRTQI